MPSPDLGDRGLFFFFWRFFFGRGGGRGAALHAGIWPLNARILVLVCLDYCLPRMQKISSGEIPRPRRPDRYPSTQFQRFVAISGASENILQSVSTE